MATGIGNKPEHHKFVSVIFTIRIFLCYFRAQNMSSLIFSSLSLRHKRCVLKLDQSANPAKTEAEQATKRLFLFKLYSRLPFLSPSGSDGSPY